MFFTTDTISYAIDAASCAEKWKQVRHSSSPSGLAVHRGFAWMNGRLFRGTSDAHALAMDPTDGRVIWDRLKIEAAFTDLPDDNRVNPLDRMLEAR